MTPKPTRVEFDPPKGFVPPEGSEGGKPFDVVCTFEVKDGKLCLKVLGETDMPGYDDNDGDEQDKPAPDYKTMGSDMAATAPADAGAY